jgi:hypothetical protein
MWGPSALFGLIVLTSFPRYHMETTSDLRRYARQYDAARKELATGHKDTGLRILWALRYHVNQTPPADTDMQRLQKLVNATAALWGEGFEWD